MDVHAYLDPTGGHCDGSDATVPTRVVTWIGDNWLGYFVVTPDDMDDLMWIDPIIGKWVEIRPLSDGFLTISRDLVLNLSIPMNEGSDQVGYPAQAGADVVTSLTGVSYDRVEGQDPDPPYLIVSLQEDYPMVPGQGDWIQATRNRIWDP